jgi:hypothetical protein
MQRARRNQPDLFEAARVADLRPDLRSKLAPLLQALLAEAAGMESRQSKSDDRSEEAGDDQDHV